METVKQHLVNRHLDLDLHHPIIDEINRIATFYLYNLSEQIVGYQQYRPDGSKKKSNNPKEGKYFTYRRKDTHSIWGLESLSLSPNVVFLTEGIFDACRLTQFGYSALAVLSNNPSLDLRNWLMMLNRKVIVIADNDNAGRKLAKFGHCVEFTEEHDLGDSSNEYVKNLVLKYGEKNG
jgi:DNA primase